MSFKSLEVVVLKRDLAEHNLKTGDLGTIVEVYDSGDVEVEFITANGMTKAIITLIHSDIRNVKPTDMLAVRSLQPAR
ncbi:DUF4926 domain-containing protein [Candidatus Acetothermia bacterium]|nr:DUF4926 domain-containing protein [Candidatus Acetothermia bacterium]MBI3642707.1 DUF4926 domain-containing protein [Candidatus Acetothermia bacterium]